MIKRFLLMLWNALHELRQNAADGFRCVFDAVYRRVTKAPVVAGVEETICAVRDNGWSFARFGDGEIKLVAGRSISFQTATPFVTQKLREVLSSDTEGLMIGLADIFGCRDRYTEKATAYWKKHLRQYRRVWYRYIRKGKLYYNASATRQYISLKDPGESEKIFALFKEIWKDRDVVFIEGEKSRLGVGNDLFDGARSVRRILGPSAQAFSKYNELLQKACELEKGVLFLLALGPCATALAYDLHLRGYQAVDVGHIDVEYEWMRMKAAERMPLQNKMVFEAGGIADDALEDPVYLSQIIGKII